MAVAQDGHALWHAAPALKADPDVVAAAVMADLAMGGEVIFMIACLFFVDYSIGKSFV